MIDIVLIVPLALVVLVVLVVLVYVKDREAGCPNKKGKAKTYQVKQVLAAIEKLEGK